MYRRVFPADPEPRKTPVLEFLHTPFGSNINRFPIPMGGTALTLLLSSNSPKANQIGAICSSGAACRSTSGRLLEPRVVGGDVEFCGFGVAAV